jgi:hypothetical protein
MDSVAHVVPLASSTSHAAAAVPRWDDEVLQSLMNELAGRHGFSSGEEMYAHFCKVGTLSMGATEAPCHRRADGNGGESKWTTEGGYPLYRGSVLSCRFLAGPKDKLKPVLNSDGYPCGWNGTTYPDSDSDVDKPVFK